MSSGQNPLVGLACGEAFRGRDAGCLDSRLHDLFEFPLVLPFSVAKQEKHQRQDEELSVTRQVELRGLAQPSLRDFPYVMPELAEVEYYRRRWEPFLGSTVSRVKIHEGNRIFRDCDPVDLARSLPGRKFNEARRHGKRMLFRFGDDGWLSIHLGMAGKLMAEPSPDFELHKHDHLVIYLDNGVLIFRDTRYFGLVGWQLTQAEPSWWLNRGPDLLAANYKWKDLAASITRRKRSPLKSVLLDQDLFPGVGNWMADEILWRAALYPGRKGESLQEREMKRLYKALREVCKDALRVIAPDWSKPPDTWLFNHRWRDGGTCPKTGEPLRRIQVGGRTTCYSPARQGS